VNGPAFLSHPCARRSSPPRSACSIITSARSAAAPPEQRVGQLITWCLRVPGRPGRVSISWRLMGHVAGARVLG
jgi:hypothetical protein